MKVAVTDAYRQVDAAGMLVTAAEILADVDVAGIPRAGAHVASADHARADAAMHLGLVEGGVVASGPAGIVAVARAAAGVAVVHTGCLACGRGGG